MRLQDGQGRLAGAAGSSNAGTGPSDESAHRLGRSTGHGIFGGKEIMP